MGDESAQHSARQPTVTAKGVRGMVFHAVSKGVSRESILQAVGLDPAVLMDPDGRVPRAQVAEIWRFISEALQDPALPLSVIQALPYGSYDVLDYAFGTSPTVAHGVGIIARYLRLFLDLAELRLEPGDEITTLHYQVYNDDEGIEPFSAEYSVGLLVSRLRQCADHPAPNPLWITFAHETRANPQLYEDWCRCPVTFSAGANRLALRNDLFHAPLKTADAGVHGVMERHAAVLLDLIPQMDAMENRVRRELFAMFTSGMTMPTIDDLAARMGMGARTLQRVLAEEDTSFVKLLDDTRFELSMRFLNDESVSIAEIGFLLGFSEPSAFHRAFRRWSGDTPGATRKRLLRLPD